MIVFYEAKEKNNAQYLGSVTSFCIFAPSLKKMT